MLCMLLGIFPLVNLFNCVSRLRGMSTIHTALPSRLFTASLAAAESLPLLRIDPPRTLHTAQNADDIKWVMQQWIARGYPTPKAVLKAVKVAALAGPEADVAAAAAAAGGEAGAPEQQAVQREVFKVVASSSSVEGYGSQPSKGKAKRGSKKGSGKGFSRR